MRIHPAGLVFNAVLAVSVMHAQPMFMGMSTSGDTTTVTLKSPRPFAPSPIMRQ